MLIISFPVITMYAIRVSRYKYSEKRKKTNLLAFWANKAIGTSELHMYWYADVPCTS